jgi:hypothetical protein
MINNFHKRIWTLTKKDAMQLGLYEPEKSNQFWLVPEVHSGKPKKIKTSTYPPGSLCFVVGYEDKEMKSIWKNLKLFKAGTRPAGEPLTKNGHPRANQDTYRLEAKITMGGKASIVTLVLHPSKPKQMFVNHSPEGMYGGAGEDGWARVDD